MEDETKATRERLAGSEEQVNDPFDTMNNRVNDRLNRIETSINRLIQLHQDAEAPHPASGR